MLNIVPSPIPGDPNLPKTRVEAVLRKWMASKGRLITYKQAEDAYCGQLQTKGPLRDREYTGMTMTRLLKKYGHKTGKAGDRSPWKFGKPSSKSRKTKLKEVTYMTRVCDHCGHPNDTGTHMIDCPMLRGGIDLNKCMHCAVHHLDCTHMGVVTDVYDIPSGLEPVGFTPPTSLPHLTTKSPLLLSMESAVEITRKAMLRANFEYGRALEECNTQVKLERTMVWAREQLADITDPVQLRALNIVITQKRDALK